MPLKVTIHSFSYLKRGIPNDETGNGGGFVFDCRFVNNPGRQEEFKLMTGKDAKVIEFLDSQEPMQKFLNNVYDIIDPAIENYIQRDFSSLMISFGCTGGQHRSIYAAEAASKHVKEKFKNQVEVVVKHNEYEGI
jgi:RNase adaptor protein for sRNA GlmZ degradation